MSEFDLDPEVERWIADGLEDIELWALKGLGIQLHPKQVEALKALRDDPASFYLWYWANRVGKTTAVVIWHLHGIFYKTGIRQPTTEFEQDLWQAEDYRRLHTAPIGLLATRAYDYIVEMSKGTHPAQRDEQGNRRPAPLGYLFVPAKERDAHGADHMVVRCVSSGGTLDFFSTEGGAGRLESAAWWAISWDEWPQQEAADKPTAIRTVLTRLENRASDYHAKICLTGTITPETEHIAKEWIELCEDPGNIDWWGSEASRFDNPAANRDSMSMAERTMDPEDYARTIMGIPGGVKNRLFPSFLVEPIFQNDLPAFTPPHPQDGMGFGDDGRRSPRGEGSPWAYLHVWDLAIAAAANVGHVVRVPANWEFGWRDVDGKRVLLPIEGVRRMEIPGSRTLTTAEIIHTIEEVYLPYGGQIVLDTTDAHGKSIHRELRKAGYPVEGFTFNERDERKVLKKDAAIHHTLELLGEGMALVRDAQGEQTFDALGVPIFDRETPYGVLRLPKQWRKARDQLSILRPDDDHQVKDEAMVVLMTGETAYRIRRRRTRQIVSQPAAAFGGGRRY